MNLAYPVVDFPGLLGEIQTKLSTQTYSLGNFNSLSRHFDLVEKAANDLIKTDPDQSIKVMGYLFSRCSDQVFNDYWNQGIAARAGHMLANIINKNPTLNWRRVRDAARAQSSQSRSLEGSILKPLILKSIYSYGNTLHGIFPSYSIAEAFGILCTDKNYFEPDQQKIQDTNWRLNMGLEPEHEEQFDWSTPTAKNNLAAAILASLSTTEPNCDFLAFKLQEIASDQLEISALMGTIRTHTQEHWSEYSREEQAKLLFLDFMLFNAISNLNSPVALKSHVIVSKDINTYLPYLNVSESDKTDKRTEFINQLYQKLIPAEQLSYIHSYLNLVDPAWVDIKTVDRLYAESLAQNTVSVETPLF